MESDILIVVLAFPILGAFLLLLLRGRVQDWLAFLLPVLYLVAGIEAVRALLNGSSLQATVTHLPWLDEAGVFSLRLDALSAILLLVVLIIGFLVMAFSIGYMGPRNKEHPVLHHEGNSRYYFFLSLFIASMVGLALAANLFVLFFFWEATTLCSWALISHYSRRPFSVMAGLKALIMTHVGGAFFMIAVAVLFGLTGSFSFAALRELSPEAKTLIFLLLLVAAIAKSAQVPLFTWLPDAMEAPTPISAYLHAAAMVKAGVYLMARVIIESGELPGWSGSLMAAGGLVTMLVGLIFCFYQDDLKRFLAYSTIAQLGYIMLGLSLFILGSKTGYVAGVFHIACHSVAKALLFLSVGFIGMRLGVKSISRISGLSKKMPVTSFCFMIGLLAVTGIPPFSCFWSKLTLVLGIFSLKGAAVPLISIPFYAEIVLAFLWYLRVGQNVLFGQPSEAVAAIEHDRVTAGTGYMNALLVGLALLTLLMPWIVYPFLKAL